MNNRFVKMFAAVGLAVTCIFSSPPVAECREIVFVVNNAQSMNDSDPLRVVGESLTWSTEVFSEDDEVGVIAFKDSPLIVRPLSKIGTAPNNNSFTFNYSGGSNAGGALLKAVDVLASKFHTEKIIVVISNGEIFLNDSAAAQKSLKEFQAGLQQAKWLNIPVYILNLRYFGDAQNYHSFAADAKEIPCAYSELMTTLRTVIHDEFHSSPLTLTPQNPQGQFTFNVPFVAANKVQLMLLSSNDGNAALTNLQADKITDKDFIKIFEVNSPPTNEFSLSLNFPTGTGLTVDVLAQVEGNLLTEIGTSLFSGTVLEITPVHGNEKILGDKYFDGKTIRVQVDGNIVTAPIHGGTIKVGVDDLGDEITLQKIFFADLGLKFDGDDTARIEIGERNFLAWLLTAAGILVILTLSALLWRKNHPKLKPEVPDIVGVPKITPPVVVNTPLIRNKNFSYKGELLVFMTKAADEEFLSPRTFNLFRLNSSDEIDLATVLKNLRVEPIFDGASEIIFSPSANGVYVENNSVCTLVKLNTPIARGSHVELCHEESLAVASADGLTELTVTYRSLKPSGAKL